MADTINLNGTAPADDATTERPPREEARPKAKPRAAAKPRATAKPSDGRTPADRKLSASVSEMYTMLGMMVGGIGDVKGDPGLSGTGVALVSQSDAIAETWMDLADKNPKVKAALKNITEVSAVGAVVGIHVTCAMPLLISRGVIPGFAMPMPAGDATE